LSSRPAAQKQFAIFDLRFAIEEPEQTFARSGRSIANRKWQIENQ
jgi:hypothetical protein